MGDSLSFRDHKLTVSNLGAIQLITTPSGHLVLSAQIEERNVKEKLDTQLCFPPNGQATSFLSRPDVMILHVQLGRCKTSQFIATLTTAGYQVRREIIDAVIKTCGRGQTKSRSHVSIANSHIPLNRDMLYSSTRYTCALRQVINTRTCLYPTPFPGLPCAYHPRVSKPRNLSGYSR